jgi:hypothetical protein
MTEKKSKKTKLVESRNVNGSYDMRCVQAIIDHKDLGRILIAQGFCGMHDLRGGMYRWSGGYAIQLQPGDTFESLEKMMWNAEIGMNLLPVVLDGRDPDRPYLHWTQNVIEQVAASHNL